MAECFSLAIPGTTQSYIYLQERNDVGNHDNHRSTKKHFRVPAGRVRQSSVKVVIMKNSDHFPSGFLNFPIQVK